MDEKKSKGRKTVLPAANSFTCHEAAGWMFKLISEGWLRKRWRKRYCVLSSGILYSYEQQTADGTEKTSGSIQLKLYEDCYKAPRKECKKSPNTLILEPIKQKTGNESSKNPNQVSREFFYTESQDDLEKWLSKLKESINLSNIGADSKLKHVTKSRARPPKGSGGNRRPPSKHHLKERALMSEVAIEQPESKKDPPRVRGSMPIAALKPPVIGTFDSANTRNGGKDGVKQPLEGKQMSSKIMPSPPPSDCKPRLIERASEQEEDKGSHQISEERKDLERDASATESPSANISPRKIPILPPASPLKSPLTKKIEVVLSPGATNGENRENSDPAAGSVSMLQSCPGSDWNESIEKCVGDDSLVKKSSSEVGDLKSPLNGVLRHRQKDVLEESLSDGKALQVLKEGRAKSMVILASQLADDRGSSPSGIFFGEAAIEKEAKPKTRLEVRPSSLVIYPS